MIVSWKLFMKSLQYRTGDGFINHEEFVAHMTRQLGKSTEKERYSADRNSLKDSENLWENCWNKILWQFSHGAWNYFWVVFWEKLSYIRLQNQFSCLFLLLEKRGLEGDLQLWTQSTREKFPWTSLKGACVRSYILNYWIKYTIQIQIQIHGGKFPWTSLKYACVKSQMPSMMSTSTSRKCRRKFCKRKGCDITWWTWVGISLTSSLQGVRQYFYLILSKSVWYHLVDVCRNIFNVHFAECQSCFYTFISFY